ncbi:uncharacterized protein LOC110758410 [Prunus avium]|uniref:Uncharacterized protein LOC110758410 n=1 Tax=Prunus avium TaxID=42229 RepID=A0A6P5SQI5_PRUAV|nr:uncharacterized protein LOC110758410 [Prunus avium]
MAKSHRTVFPLSNNKAALPFELVHSDVWGPTRVTSHGFRWFVTFIDDCTRLTWVYLMKNKHDVASILPNFCAIVSTQFHAHVKVFRTDNGGEYVNHTLNQFFRDHGIIHQTTTPFTHQQNGVSERKNHQLLEVARSLMLDMSVSHHLWGHGVLAVAYLINRTPSRVLDFKTPLDVLCAHTPPVSGSKLPPKVHVTLDVTFHEEVPYYVSPSSSIQGERGNELKSFRVENVEDIGPEEGISGEQEATGRMEETTGRERICLDTTGRIEVSDRSLTNLPESDRSHIGNDRSPASMSDDNDNTSDATGCQECHDRSPGDILEFFEPLSEGHNSDTSDSHTDEIDTGPPSALPLPQSTRDNEVVCAK